MFPFLSSFHALSLLKLTQILDKAFIFVILLIHDLEVFFLLIQTKNLRPLKNIFFFFDLKERKPFAFMIVPVTRQPNIKPSLSDQTSIALNLFNTILQTTNIRV
jgi:hypothetical protein